jgi:hypothetical protein
MSSTKSNPEYSLICKIGKNQVGCVSFKYAFADSTSSEEVL